MKKMILVGLGVAISSFVISRAMIGVRDAPQASTERMRDVVALRHCGLKLNEVPDNVIERTPFKTREKCVRSSSRTPM